MVFLRQYNLKAIKQYLHKLSFKKYMNKLKEVKNIKKSKMLKKLLFNNNGCNYGSFKQNSKILNKYNINNKYYKIRLKDKTKRKENNFIFSKSDIYFFLLLFTTFISAKIYISKSSI